MGGEEEVQALGEQGWELVQYDFLTYQAIFKRPGG
jgi:hypothetical protein